MKQYPVQKICSFFLAVTLLLSQLPLPVPAEEAVSLPEETTCEPAACPEETESLPSVPTLTPPDPEPPPSEPTPTEALPAEETDPPIEDALPEEFLPEPSEGLPEETPPEETCTEEPPVSAEVVFPEIPGLSLYFGRFHAHSTISDGDLPPEELFRLAARTEGLDFFAVTDHSDSFACSDLGTLEIDAAAVSSDWAAGKATAAAVSSADFTGLFGFEMSWPAKMQLGHISTFFTPGFYSWQQPSFRSADSALQNYYDALSRVPGAIGQFNHPGRQYGSFQSFAFHSPEADRVMALLEVGCGDNAAPYRFYTQALDAGWHVAPANNQTGYDLTAEGLSSGRTVIYAEDLTEDGISEALRSRRVYATEDADLELFFILDGHLPGSRLLRPQLGSTATICVYARDLSDETVGLVEVISDGGITADASNLETACGSLEFSLSPESHYYYLRITQPDGDTAVTAPIWIDGTEAAGISDLRCSTAVPVQQEPAELELSLFNHTGQDFLAGMLEVYADGERILTENLPLHVPAGETLTHRLSFVSHHVGMTQIRIRLSGTLAGIPVSYEDTLTLSFRQSRQVRDLLLDTGHGNAGLETLTVLSSLAAENDIRICSNISADALKNCRYVLVTAPSKPFSPEFLALMAEYAAYGGSAILCGTAADAFAAGELNRLLSAMGSTMALLPGTDSGSTVFTDGIHSDAHWCSLVNDNQVYRFVPGGSVDPGQGLRLVSDSGQVLLACETLHAGGTVFAAASLFLADENVAEPEDLWQEPFANRSLLLMLLDMGEKALPLSSIRQVLEAQPDTPVRIRGYVTADAACGFSDTMYLQDETGGIAVTPLPEAALQIGTPVEITGQTTATAGTLKLISLTPLDAPGRPYLPKTGSWDTLLDRTLHGAMLVQVTGECCGILCREDGSLSGFTLRNGKGQLAEILLEPHIAETDGDRLLFQLRKGRSFRAAGLLHTDENGHTVIRVRNGQEVVYVPPRRDYNPDTADPQNAGIFLAALFASGSALLLLRRIRRSK